MEKVYWAVVEGGRHISASGTLDAPLMSKDRDAPQQAVTRYRVVARGQRTTWLELQPITGAKKLRSVNIDV